MKYTHKLAVELINGLGIGSIFYTDSEGNNCNIYDTNNNPVDGIHVAYINLDKHAVNHDAEYYESLMKHELTNIANFLFMHYHIEIEGNKAIFENGELIIQPYEFEYVARQEPKNIRVLSVVIQFVSKKLFS